MSGTTLGFLKGKLGLRGETKPGDMLSALNFKKKSYKLGSTKEPKEYMKHFKCKSCGAMYKSHSALQSHMKSHVKSKTSGIKKSGTSYGKSNRLGHGGRAAQLRARGVPSGVIGNLARAAGAAKGGPNYHGK